MAPGNLGHGGVIEAFSPKRSARNFMHSTEQAIEQLAGGVFTPWHARKSGAEHLNQQRNTLLIRHRGVNTPRVVQFVRDDRNISLEFVRSEIFKGLEDNRHVKATLQPFEIFAAFGTMKFKL